MFIAADRTHQVPLSLRSPLFHFADERPFIVSEVSRRVYHHYLLAARQDDQAGIEYVLNEAAYQEIDRLQGEQGPEEELRSMGWWKQLAKQLASMSEQQKRAVLRELVEVYTDDIAGQFDPRVYRLTTGFLPLGLGFLFKAQDLKDVPNFMAHARSGLRHLRDLSERVVQVGHIETVRRLAEKGTLIFVPTHSSNMDSILVGWSLWAAGLPPVTYGAGKNLFTNPLTSFFMHNLGAYKVDRRLRFDLYKRLLKVYSQVLLERGYHSLFFPGGTRCRSNIVESHLKLGLLGTAVSAYTQHLLDQGHQRRFYICPITINYNLVLEAESLIRDYLRSEGRSRYFLKDDEFNQLSTVVRFVMNTVRMESTTVLRFGQPMDPFGNRVESDGESYDIHGRRMNIEAYVRSAQTRQLCQDNARDRQYTSYTGAQIAESFRRETVVMPTQVVSYVLFSLLEQRFPKWDIYRLLRIGGEEIISLSEVRAGVAALLDYLKNLEQQGLLHLAPFLLEEKSQRVTELGIEYLRMYHLPEVVDFHGQGIVLNKLDLLYFYSNRLRAFDLDDEIWLKAAQLQPGRPSRPL